jgi:hypothetical protein
VEFRLFQVRAEVWRALAALVERRRCCGERVRGAARCRWLGWVRLALLLTRDARRFHSAAISGKRATAGGRDQLAS